MPTKCRICGKAITDQDAQFGPDCQARFDEALQILDTTPEEVGTLFLTGDATVQRWLSTMTTALICSLKTMGAPAAKHRENAIRFMDAARRAAADVSEVSILLLDAATAEPAEEPEPEIAIENKGGFYKMRLPFRHPAFLREFETRIGRRWRCWHIQSESWHITPADREMVDYIAGIVRQHFKGYVVRVSHEISGRAAA